MGLQTIHSSKEERSGKVCEQKVKCKPCANPACKYQVTWHTTHCCAKCAKGGKGHGSRCERKEVPEAAAKQDAADSATNEDVMPKEEAVAPEPKAEAITKEDQEEDNGLQLQLKLLQEMGFHTNEETLKWLLESCHGDMAA